MSQGFLVRGVAGKESTYGTGVTVDNIIPFLSESLNRAVTKIQAAYLDGSASVQDIRNSVIEATGDMEFELVYDEIAGAIIGNDLLFHAMLGSSAFDTTHNEFSPTLQLDESLTIALSKGVSVWEILGAKINTWEISGKAQENIVGSLSLIGQNLLRTGDAGIVNAAAAIAALNPTNRPTQLAFDDLVFRIGAHGAALANSDRVQISEFSLSGNNNLTEPEWASPAENGNALLTLEPIRNGKREITLSITVPRYAADTFFTGLNANTAYQAELLFQFSGTKEVNIYLPNIRVTEGDAPTGGPESITQSFTFQAIRNGSTNTDMAYTNATAITEEIGIETENARTTAP